LSSIGIRKREAKYILALTIFLFSFIFIFYFYK
jgi:hypothetical protein